MSHHKITFNGLVTTYIAWHHRDSSLAGLQCDLRKFRKRNLFTTGEVGTSLTSAFDLNRSTAADNATMQNKRNMKTKMYASVF